MTKHKRKLPVVLVGAGFLAGLLVGVGMMVGTLYTVNQTEPAASKVEAPTATKSVADFPFEEIKAAAAHGGKTIAVATGQIDDESEGIFVLDFLTGNLYCWVVHPRAWGAGFIGQYKHNVVGDLPVAKGKDPDYVLTTASIGPVPGGGAARPARCICYVTDSNTGIVAGYSLPWNITMAAAGRLQGGPMLKVAVGQARPNIGRDQ